MDHPKIKGALKQNTRKERGSSKLTVCGWVGVRPSEKVLFGFFFLCLRV